MSRTATTTALGRLHHAGRWFLDSGIQEESGGVARYYRIDLGRNNRLSTEITGYAVSAFCYLFRETSDDRYLQAAVAAGKFLTRNAWRNPVFPFEWPETALPAENRAYFFDSGIIIRGLMKLWKLTGDREFRDIALASGQAMAHVFEHGSEFAPILQLPDLTPVPYGGSWSNNPGCYQLKSALGWLELYEETGDPVLLESWDRALARALANDRSFLPGTPETLRIMDRLHAYSYFLEALLPVADRHQTQLSNGIDRVASYLRDIAPQFARSDVYGQLLRVRIFADRLGAVKLNVPQASEEAAAIARFQWSDPAQRLDGGYCFGRRGSDFAPYANPVSTAFCMQALHMWDDWQAGRFECSWRDLI